MKTPYTHASPSVGGAGRPHRRLATWRAAIFATLVLAAAACGTSSRTASHPTTSAADTSASAQFAVAGDRICAAEDKQESTLGPGLINPDIVPAPRLPKAAAYLDQIVAIRNQGLPALEQMAADASAPDKNARSAFALAAQTVISDYHTAAVAAHAGNLAQFRAALDRVAPGGRPNGPRLANSR